MRSVKWTIVPRPPTVASRSGQHRRHFPRPASAVGGKGNREPQCSHLRLAGSFGQLRAAAFWLPARLDAAPEPLYVTATGSPTR